MTCSQLSSTIRIRSSRRKSTIGRDRFVRSQDEPQCRREGADHERRVFDRGQIDEQHSIAESCRARSRRSRSPSEVLPIPAGPAMVTMRLRDNSRETASMLSERPTITVPRAGRLLLAPTRAPPAAEDCPSALHPVHLGGKAIAAARHVGHVPCVRLRVAKRLAQVLDMEAQAAFLDIHVAPDARKQRSVWDDFAGALDKDDEKVESPAAETHGASLPLQSAFCREETEWAECEHRVPVVEHSQSFKMPRSQATARPAVWLPAVAVRSPIAGVPAISNVCRRGGERHRARRAQSAVVGSNSQRLNSVLGRIERTSACCRCVFHSWLSGFGQVQQMLLVTQPMKLIAHLLHAGPQRRCSCDTKARTFPLARTFGLCCSAWTYEA